MNCRTIGACAAAIAAGSVAAQQTELVFCFTEIGHTPSDEGIYAISAELLNPTGSVLAAVSDLSFSVSWRGMHSLDYNPSFDSDFFGDASATVTDTSIEFSGGNTLPPLNNAGGVDSSNPLFIASFVGEDWGPGDIPILTINGQLTGAYSGVPFPTILTYQNADGTAGNTPYRIWNKFIPAPASVAVLGLGGFAAARRRR